VLSTENVKRQLLKKGGVAEIKFEARVKFQTSKISPLV
jgi:hypothetical protein